MKGSESKKEVAKEVEVEVEGKQNKFKVVVNHEDEANPNAMQMPEEMLNTLIFFEKF